MQSTPEAADRLARRAAALAFATQGMVFISLTTRLPRFSDRWDLSEVELSLVLLDDRPAGRRRLGGRRAVGAPQRQRQHPSRRAAHHRGRRPGGRRRTDRPGLRRRRSRCTAWGWASSTPPATCRRSRSSTATAARSCRRSTARGRSAASSAPCYALAAAHAPLWTAGLVAVVPLLAIAAPYLRREHGEALAAAAQVAVPWRPIVLVGLGMVLFYMVDTAAADLGTDLPRRRRRRPQSLVALATLPYLRRQPGRAAGRRPLVARYGAVAGPPHRLGGGLTGAARGGHRADLAGRGPRLHPARRRRLGGRAAELLRRGPDRRAATGPAWMP